ncbi:MAG TPA: hypothetical protein VIY53_13635 [Acidobacteriaceae bacterium]
MGRVIDFRSSPLSPFLGGWALDPLSVSRNKVVKHALGEDGLKKLWACESMETRAECLAADPDLAARYDTLRRSGNDNHLVVTLQTVTFHWSRAGFPEGKVTVYPVLRVSLEGRKAIVHTVNGPERGNQPISYVFRFSRQWLLVSERYTGRAALYFPRSPVFRYYSLN